MGICISTGIMKNSVKFNSHPHSDTEILLKYMCSFQEYVRVSIYTYVDMHKYVFYLNEEVYCSIVYGGKEMKTP